MIGVGIKAAACYLPPQVINNTELIERYDLSIDEQWIESRTGIKHRHWLADDQTTSDMVVEVARKLLDQAGLGVEQIGRIILATASGDYPSPATAVVVAQKLGVRCPAFDISAACSGFLYGLDLGVSSVQCGSDNVLVLAADARSRFIDKSDRRATVLFADGAGGVLLGPQSNTEVGFRSVHIGADGFSQRTGCLGSRRWCIAANQ